jgi:hypothetical protein
LLSLRVERRLAAGCVRLRRARNQPTSATEPAERTQEEITDDQDQHSADPEAAHHQWEQAAERIAATAAEPQATATLSGAVFEIVALGSTA